MYFAGVRLYQGLQSKVIPNYAMIAGRDLDNGLNDGLWCQSAMNVSGIGSWKLPNGNAVTDDLSANPVYMANRPGQVGLLRSSGIYYSPYQGMYTCTIPDENGVTQALVVWAAAIGVYDGKNGFSKLRNMTRCSCC